MTVLVICDDHPTFARGLQRLLMEEAPDFDVVGTAVDAASVERLVAEVAPDIVLMDIALPGVDGVEATRRIRALSPTTKIVMLTASDEASDLYQSLRAGASAYVVKDADVGEIITTIRAVGTGHLVVPSHLAGRMLADLNQTEPTLSDVDRAILGGIAAGETNRELAVLLHMSERTLRRRVGDLYAKLHLADRIEAALYASKLDLRERETP
jgi:DNA-binding NarL/FixJ family response regulator